VIRAKKVLGASVRRRNELKGWFNSIWPDEGSIVTCVDRLTRAMADMRSIIGKLEAKGTTL
jgi:DNA invertase Pin-like site-specific DNA recombinase